MIIPLAAECQVSHLDTLLAQSLAALRPAVTTVPFVWSGDSILQPLLRSAPQMQGESLPIFYIGNLSAIVEAGDSAKGRMSVTLGGALLRPGEPVARPQSISRVFDILLTKRDRMLLETNQDRYVSLERPATKSFWSNVLEPALVVLGGIVIVALFFLIRS
ncbi:MAG TPA: hypothetical protein VFX22_07115 [Candidatus Kapabacteria bacterium]|nr:hypothetical protein [Candidatus Kapabacteria bacterium]